MIDAELNSEFRLGEAKGLAGGFDVHASRIYAHKHINVKRLIKVNAHTHWKRYSTFSISAGMNGDMSSRINAARRKLGMNQATFAKALGVNQATVSRWESGSIPDPVMLTKIAELTGEDLSYFISADFRVAPGSGPVLFLKGAVAAGVWMDAWEWAREDWVQFQGGAHIEAPLEARFGLLVVGESMNEVYPPGTRLDCVSCMHAGIYEFQTGQRVIVIRRRINGEVEATVKEYLKTDEGDWLIPRSRNPAFQQPISLKEAPPDIEETRIIAVVRGAYMPE